MHRATRKRDELKLTGSKAIGHVHVKKGLSPTKINDVISKIIQNATK